MDEPDTGKQQPTNCDRRVPQRPIRWCVMAFSILAALFVVSTPFVQDIPRSVWLLAGLGFSGYFAFCAIGGILLGPRIGRPLQLFMAAVSGILLAGMILPLLVLREHGMGMLRCMVRVGQPVIGLMIVVFTAAAFWGWTRYFRGNR